MWGSALPCETGHEKPDPATDMTKSEHSARKYMHHRSCGMKRLYRISPIHSYWQFCSSHMELCPGSLSYAIFHIDRSSKDWHVFTLKEHSKPTSKVPLMYGYLDHLATNNTGKNVGHSLDLGSRSDVKGSYVRSVHNK